MLTTLEPNDEAALRLAIKLVRKDPDWCGWANSLLAKERDWLWHRAAKRIAAHEQMHSLHLPPWDHPPCHADEDDHDDPAAQLLREMLAHGISRWHPRPTKAIIEAAQRELAEAKAKR